jgi:plastocyanin
MRELTILIIVLICAALTSGCTAQTSTQKTTQQAATQVIPTAVNGPTAQVIIQATSFDPAILNIKAGTTVTWTNEDKMAHRVVHLPEVNSPELFHSESLSPGESFSYTFQKAGRYSYGDPQHGGGRSPLVIVS